jgi:major membrane immunogen (membrane-anchored lipoprotein)
MPFDRMPSISLGIIVPAGAVYDASYHWRTDAGDLRASVGFDAGRHSNAHIQGPPAALRELAAALIEAADQAEGADDPDPAVVEGWLADVGRQP